MEIQDIIKRRRHELNLTYEELGNMCGVGKTTVRKWELGLTEAMRVNNLKTLSKALKISPLELLGCVDDPYTLDYLNMTIPNRAGNPKVSDPYDEVIKTITSNCSKLDLEDLIFINKLIKKML